MEYFLTQDNDGHWFVVPVEKQKDFDKWTEMDPDDPDSWDAPEYAKQVGGWPGLVKFKEFRIE